MSSFEAAGGGAEPTEDEVERNQSLANSDVTTKYVILICCISVLDLRIFNAFLSLST
jgi:hypothetical protein